MPVTQKFGGLIFGIRHVQALLLFLNIVVIYVSRLNIGVAVVAMTNASTTNADFPEYDWNEEEISYILSSFYWGYIFTQFPGGALCKRFGAKLIMGWSTFGSALLSALTPWSVSWGGWQAFCVIRIVQGFCQGTIFPCIYDHLAKWSPKEERNRLGALSLTGIDCGNVLSLAISGIIAEGPLGWPGISYISAAMCFIWCALWWIFAANDASESRFVTEIEKQFIKSSFEHGQDVNNKNIPIPWKAIFLSLPFNALLVARCTESWGLSTLQAQTPSYIHGVLKMEIKSNALFAALPFLMMWAFSYIYIVVADILQRKKILSLTALRKIFNSIAFCIPAAGLVAISFLNETHKSWALTIMAISGGVNSGATIGSSLNTIDLAPNHSGILMGLTNTIGNFMPLISPLVVGVLVTDVHNRSQWQIVFIIAAAIFFLGNLFYITCGTTDTQKWNEENFLATKGNENCDIYKGEIEMVVESASESKDR